MAHERVPLVVIQRQLGYADLGVRSVYLQGMDTAETIDSVHVAVAGAFRERGLQIRP